MPHTRFLIPARLRRRLYARWDAYWYWALARNARDNYQELERIRQHMRGGGGLHWAARRLIEQRVTWLQRTAAPEPPPEDEFDAITREMGSIHDTTAYEYPVTTITFFPGLGLGRPAGWRSRVRGWGNGSMATPDIERLVEQYHAALDAFFRGDPSPAQALYSHEDDASLGNPFGPVAVGWAQVAEAMERAAANYRDGRATGFETLRTYVTPELAYLVEVERFEAKVGGSDELSHGALRVTSILRPEAGEWRIVHRHADPITAPRPASSVVN